jgi:hypothetical protein
VPNVFGRVAAAYTTCGRSIASVDLLPARNPNHVRFRLTFADGSRLHVSEAWQHEALGAYSYYWLDAHDALIQGWDNAPHHSHLANYPHHTHIGAQHDLQSSYATTLEDVLTIIQSRFDDGDS